MSDHIFTVSVKSRLADALRSKNGIYDAYNRLTNKDGGYAAELLEVAALHQQVERIWRDALAARPGAKARLT